MFWEEDDTTTYGKINKVEVKSPNIILLALSIGNLDVTTPGNNPDIHMRNIAHPFFIQDRIYEIQNFKSKFDKAKNAKELKVTFILWISIMLSTIQTTCHTQFCANF